MHVWYSQKHVAEQRYELFEKTRSHFWFWSKTSNVCRSASTDKTAICKQHWQQTSVGDAKSTMKKRGRNRHASPTWLLPLVLRWTLCFCRVRKVLGGRSGRRLVLENGRSASISGRCRLGCWRLTAAAATNTTLVTLTSRWWHRHHADDNGVTLVILVPHWWHCHHVGDTGITLVALTSRWWHWHHVGGTDITLVTSTSRWWQWYHAGDTGATSCWWHWHHVGGTEISVTAKR